MLLRLIAILLSGFVCDFFLSVTTICLLQQRACMLALIIFTWTYVAAFAQTEYCKAESKFEWFLYVTVLAVGNVLGALVGLYVAW